MEWTPDSILDSDQKSHCLVIDTNIILTDLNLVTQILDVNLPGKVYFNTITYYVFLQYYILFYLI